MLAVSWLQPIVERYEQEGLKSEANALQLMMVEKGKNIADDLRKYEVCGIALRLSVRVNSL